MARYLYTVWFRDNAAEVDDQDREWPGCILITANSELAAKHWGDYLAHGYCGRNPDNQIIDSSVELKAARDLKDVPSVVFGEEAPDDVIGW